MRRHGKRVAEGGTAQHASEGTFDQQARWRSACAGHGWEDGARENLVGFEACGLLLGVGVSADDESLLDKLRHPATQTCLTAPRKKLAFTLLLDVQKFMQ